MHVVFGANGRAGGETARALMADGEPVRVVVRRPEQGKAWAALGAEVAVASLDNAEQVSAALKGATAAFLLNPPPVAGDPFGQTADIGAALAQAVRRADLARSVILSSIGAQHETGTGVIATLHQVEAMLAGTAPATAFLRSGYFVETWSEVAEACVSDGVLPSFLEPDRKIPMVSTTDVGRAAARLMSQNWAGTRIVELAGPEDWSANDVAAAFAKVLGRPVEPVLVPPEQREAVLAEAGLSAEVTAALLGMYEGIANGRFTRQAGTEDWRGTTSLTAAVERIVTKLRPAA
ncbi:MAG: NmrA family protein [Mesorhizobium sp.]|uniref:NmrA family NAD(P)-binding protein n=1 Tax=unclassified Mesorhizobium TaxID=325217 RepID=UPI000FE9615D|nr:MULTISPECIES: NmrA family NAD(P)-binding protein [unclassified Mesorhizobium]RWB31929.1 MAG: NmrA family protein [Mesorhizobium sp.]RWB81242.1 MAG: NmrA family protein [Mesorhizobium sp.]RWC10884.1 MAG: NmrA family protein [Mesorhizobium sp.]TGU00940.1 NmrA family protein [Mesorhizobium sp. M5C.F.Ca.ET.164.01.1.1]